MHGWDSNTPLEETLRTLDDLVRQGKVRYIDTNLMSWQAATAVMLQERLGLEKYVTAQMYYSLVGRAWNTSFSRSPSITTSASWFGARGKRAFLPVITLRGTPAPASARFAEAGRSSPLIGRWATGLWKR